MPTSLDDKNKRAAKLTNVNLSIIEQFEVLVECDRSYVKDYKKIATGCLIEKDVETKNVAIDRLTKAMDKLVDGQAELLMYLRMEILESNQKSLELGQLNRKIKALESTSLN